MRLTRLEMDNFGPFSGHKVDGFSSGLTVVHGENEAGKSALRAFMRVILFGFPRARSQERADYYYEPILPGGAGGSLFVTDPNGDPYSINRVEGVRGGPVTISGTRDGGDDLLHELIGGVDDAFYQNVFSISLTQLQSFEALGRDEIPERIYSAGLGMGNVSLRGVTRTLDDRISRLQRTASTRSTAGSLFDVEKQLRTAREKLDEKRRELAEYGRLSDELRELERSAKELGEELSELRASAARTGRLLDLRDSWLNARRLRDEISSLPASRPILVGGVERLDEIERVRRETEERIAQDDRRERERNRQVADLPVVEAFARREDDVRKVVGRIGYYQDAV
ncbi:MAG: AAA family ATPase [Chloroflexi bacterium]|nr:AAA family ATPase [Chloroflexota bacterium]